MRKYICLFVAVHGNGNVRLCSVNARKLVVLAGCPDVPVYEGAGRSIKDMSSDTPSVGTSIVHGKNGFGEVEPPVDVSGWSPPAESAAQALCRMVSERPGKVCCTLNFAMKFWFLFKKIPHHRFPTQYTLVTLGPLTNLATAIIACPSITVSSHLLALGESLPKRCSHPKVILHVRWSHLIL